MNNTSRLEYMKLCVFAYKSDKCYTCRQSKRAYAKRKACKGPVAA